MRQLSKRVEKLESVLLVNQSPSEIERMSPEERHRRIAELSYQNGSYNGYVFKSLEEYDNMTQGEQTQYINEVAEVMRPWVEETRARLKKEGIL